MFEIVLYVIGFLVITLLIQYMLHKFRKNKNHGKNAIFVGNSAAIGICTIGILEHDINFLGAVIGFLLADEIGKQMGWQ